MAESEGNDYLERLLALCREVFASGHYEASNHLLSAAIHIACDQENEAALEQIERLAREQSAWINNFAPQSIMSAQSAKARHGIDLYEITIRQAAAHAGMIRENRRRRGTPSSE